MKIIETNHEEKLKECTDFAMENITKICNEIGPRESASKEERKAQEYWAEKMGEFADKVEIEQFDVHPHAFMSWVIIDATLLLTGFVFYFAFKLPIVSLILTLIAVLCMGTEFLFYKQFLDPLFKKKTSCNVIGKREPVGQVKQRIIFSGHCDSSWEWWYTAKGGSVLLKSVIIPAIVGLIYVLVVNIVTVAVSGVNSIPDSGILKVMAFLQLVFTPVFIALYPFVNWKGVVQGANDNLTGCGAAVSVLKYLSDNNIRFENTEVIALTTGCEEAGLRGANAYAKRHKKEFDSATTIFFGMDTLTDFDDMAIYIRDMTGTVLNDERVCALMKAGSERAGLDLPYRSVFFGASDAAAVSKAGLPAATLAAMDPAPARYYHTRYDTPEKLQPETFKKALDTCIQSLYIFDEQGLKNDYE